MNDKPERIGMVAAPTEAAKAAWLLKRQLAVGLSDKKMG